MDFYAFLASFASSSLTIFVIMDPLASIAPFLLLTKGANETQVKKTATQAVAVAGAVAVAFMLVGPLILTFLGVTLKDFQIAGGLVLGVLAMEMVLGLAFREREASAKKSLSAVAALIGTPMLTGPGLMSSMILLEHQYGYLTVIISLFPALVASWLVLGYSPRLRSMLGDRTLEIASRVLGLLLLAVAVSFVRAGF